MPGARLFDKLGVFVTIFVRRAVLMAAVIVLTACVSDVPQPKFPQLTYEHLGAFKLDVSTLEIVDAYQPKLGPPNVDHSMPLAPAAAARQWASDRLKSTGSSGRRAVFTIEDGAVTETALERQTGVRGVLTIDQSERYDGVLAVRLEVFDLTGKRLGLAETRARRDKSVKESATLNERDEVWFQMTKSLVEDLNAEMDRAIPSFLGDYLR